MAAEFSAIALQTVAANQPAVFTETRAPCKSGRVFHQDGSGLFLLASRVIPPCARNGYAVYESLYLVTFQANVAIPDGGTVGPISVAIAAEGEADGASTMIFTPSATLEYGNISTSVIVAVPSICRCKSISVRNITENGSAINMQNANITIATAGIQLAN